MALRDLTPGEMPPPWRTVVLGRILRAQTLKEETEAQQLRVARSVVVELTDLDTIIYTDGSAEGGVASGRAGVVVCGGEEMEVLEEWSAPAGAVTSSFAAEAVALQEALGWLRNSTQWTQAAVITNSQSLLAVLYGDGGDSWIGALRETLWELGERVSPSVGSGPLRFPGQRESRLKSKRGRSHAPGGCGVGPGC